MNYDYLSLDESVEYLNLSRKKVVTYRLERLYDDMLSSRLPVYGRFFPRGAEWRTGRLIAHTDIEAQAVSRHESSVKPVDYLGSWFLRRRKVARERQFLDYPIERKEFTDGEIEIFVKAEMMPSTTTGGQPTPSVGRKEAERRVRESIEAGVEVSEYEKLHEPIRLCVAGGLEDHIQAELRGGNSESVDVIVAELESGRGAVLYLKGRCVFGWPDGARLVFRRADLDALVCGERQSFDQEPKRSDDITERTHSYCNARYIDLQSEDQAISKRAVGDILEAELKDMGDLKNLTSDHIRRYVI